MGKEVVKIPGAGKQKEEKGAAAGCGGGSNSRHEESAAKNKKKPAAASSSSPATADFSPPRSVQKKPRSKTNNAFNSMSEFSAG